MKPGNWACCSAAAALVLLLLVLLPAPAAAVAIEPLHAQVLAAAEAQPPADTDPRWHSVALPNAVAAEVAWYRIEFAAAGGAGNRMWLLYLPYMYGGGQVWLNGAQVGAVPEGTAERYVRWERPLLLPLPSILLRDGGNVLHLRPVATQVPRGSGLARVVVGTQDSLQPQFERRLFFVRTVPLVTVLGGSAVGLFVLFIWLRRRQEVLYGLFGLAVLLWALRTTTFVFDTMPAAVWPLWRLLYHATTGGFVIVMTLFALTLAGWYRRGIAIGLFAYWLLGPLAFVLGGAQGEMLVGRWWAAGLIPIGLAMGVATAAAAWRRPNVETVAVALAVALAVAAGVHDYLVAWRSPWLQALLPNWSDHRIFLLHHGANLLLVVMGMLLSLRFVRSLEGVEEAYSTTPQAARVIAGTRQLGRLKHDILAIGPTMLIPAAADRAEHWLDWWISSWEPTYQEVRLSDLRSVDDLADIVFDAGVQLGASKLVSERKQVLSSVTALEGRLRMETARIVEELLAGWRQLTVR